MIVHLHDFGWHMDINLEYVCVRAGLRDKWRDQHGNSHTYIPFTLVHARKIFRLIKEYAESEVLINAESYVWEYAQTHHNKRIWEQWEKA